MDRTSELPTEILHNILSRLSTKTAAQTSVLSKPWLKACSTNPKLSFDESDFKRQHGKFLKIVDDTLEKYHREKLLVSNVKLCIFFSDQTDCDGIVDKWLDIIAKKKVSQVSLLVKSISGLFSERYNLSADSIFAMESLQQLELNQCKILKLKSILFEDSKIKCRNLKSLSLCYVTVSESTLDTLISCCGPHLMMISFQHCTGFSCIRVSNLPNLLSLNILCCPIEEVHIVDAPKLLSFEYTNKYKLEPYSYGFDVFLRSLNIGTCQNLRRVEFVKATIDDIDLFQLIQKLPFIKELSLRYFTLLGHFQSI
nr:putative F-box/LRR-repeat protein At5g02930 [Nicotiana tomentosiformis]